MNPIEQMLREEQGHSFAHIETKTNPCKTSKKIQSLIDEMGHHEIIKISSRNVSIGNSYQTAVQNRLIKNNQNPETFEATPRSWATRVSPGLIQHSESGQMYVEYYYLSAAPTTSQYVWENGEQLTTEELQHAKENLFKKHSPSAKQANAGLTEEQHVKVNIVKLENVTLLKAFGRTAWMKQK